jgi:GTPase Era involved in 16S rRNA processing
MKTNLSKNYFLLYHNTGLIFTQESTPVEMKDDNSVFEMTAIILSISRKEFDKAICLESFQEILEKLNFQVPLVLNDLFEIQNTLIQNIISKDNNEASAILKKVFDYLHLHTLLLNSDYKKLLSLFSEYEDTEDTARTNPEKKAHMAYAKKDLMQSIIVALRETSLTQNGLENLTSIEKNLTNQKFSIGVTGVMNAGKSTLLNALIGQDILGTSVIPETASLTYIKNGTSNKAEITYWNTQEWARIEKSSEGNASIKSFIERTHKAFDTTLNDYISESSKSELVEVSDLSLYTSAQKSNEKCNLIKHVELMADLSFLQNNIEIVDTPGLDDPVVQREEITKEYIYGCDMLMHLMNVTQSATKKDIEFIVDAVCYQNVTNLLIVLTKADNISEEELQSVVAYTKNAIDTELNKQNKSHTLDGLSASIKFISSSAKTALEHKMSQEPYDINIIKETGLQGIEEHLKEKLQSMQDENNPILNSTQKRLASLLKSEQKHIALKLSLSKQSKEQMIEKQKAFLILKKEKEVQLKALEDTLFEDEKRSALHFSSLDSHVKSGLSSLQAKIKDRVGSDIKYTFEKTKTKPNFQRIASILETTIKDGIVDVMQEYKYKLDTYLNEELEQYTKAFMKLSIPLDNGSFIALFKEVKKVSFYSISHTQMIQSILNDFKKVKSSNINAFNAQMKEHIAQHFHALSLYINEKTNTVSSNYPKDFFGYLRSTVDDSYASLKYEEENLEAFINQSRKEKKNDFEDSASLKRQLQLFFDMHSEVTSV